MEVASEYFRSGADKISIGSDAVFAAEAVARSHAINMAAERGMVRVEFETDSQLLGEALDLHRVDSSVYAAVIEDMKYQLKLWFSYFSIFVCRRTANSVAHELASIGLLCEPAYCMQGETDVPAQVGVSVLGDMPKTS